MKNRIRISDICAYMALLFSVTTIILWICNVGGFTVVSLDTFVGVIVALLAIIVAFVMGWQIYNAIDLKEHIKKVNDLDEKFNYLKNDLDEKFDSLQHDLMINMAGNYVNLANSLEKENDYEGAFVAYHTLFLYAIICRSSKLDSYITKMRELLPKITKIEDDQIEIVERDMKKIRMSDPYFQYLKKDYDKIISEFLSKKIVNNEHTTRI